MRAVYAGSPGGTDTAIDTVPSFIDGSPTLQVYADIANGSKHFKLSTSQTGDYATTINENDVVVFPGNGISAHRFRIASAGQQHDVLDVAEKAVAEWRVFLTEHHLL